MKRLLEDSQLPSELRADLLRTRAAGRDYPAAAKLLQLRAAMSERAPQPVEALQASPKSALLAGWKLGVLLVLGGSAAFLAQTVTPAAQPEHTLSSPPPAADTSTPANSAAATSAMLAPAVLVPPEPAHEAQPSAAATSEHETVAAQPTPDRASSSRREIAQLVKIRALLERDPTGARRLAERSEREFPRGLLSEERRALAIVALAKMGTKQLAERDAQRYFARYPHSPMRELIEAALHH